MQELTKENRISEELDRIIELFFEVDENQRAIVMPLLQNAAFMKVTLEELQEKINAEGVTEFYQNGANQHGVKQSATLQSYNSLIKNYASVIKTLSQIVPRKKKFSSAYERWTAANRPKTPEELESYRKELEEENERIRQQAYKLLHGE